MSHNAVLIHGLGQVQPERDLGQAFPTYGRIVGYSRADDYVYFAGDATRCYLQEPINTSTSETLSTWGRIPEVYTQRALPYLKRYVRHILFLRNKYFVVFDDLSCSRPATFTWLYHILPDQPLDFDPEHFAVDYNVGDVKVRLQQIAHTDNLRFDDRKGLDGHINPITGEDYREYYQGDILCGHNLWISNKEKAREWQFLTVIYPEPPDGQIPVIKALDDSSVQVGDDMICFDPRSELAGKADFLVDITAFRQARKRPAQSCQSFGMLTRRVRDIQNHTVDCAKLTKNWSPQGLNGALIQNPRLGSISLTHLLTRR